jgi:hypothetical protein
MQTHPYYVKLDRHLFAELVGVRKRARLHKLTIRTRGKDCKGEAVVLTSLNSLWEIEWYLDQLEQTHADRNLIPIHRGART